MLSQTLKLVKKVDEIDADQTGGNNGRKTGQHFPKSSIEITAPHNYWPNQLLTRVKKPGGFGTGIEATEADGGD